MNKANNNREQCNASQSDGARSREFFSELHGVSGSTLIETIPTQFSDVRSSSRISARRIASADQGSAAGNQTSNFVRTDSSVMVTTRRQCSPRGITLTLSVKSKRVMRFNLQNILPAELDSAQGIIDDDSFVANLQTWVMDNQINPDRYEGCNGNTSRRINRIPSKDGLQNSQEEQSVTAVRSKDRRLGTEEFNVGHSDVSLICEGLHV